MKHHPRRTVSGALFLGSMIFFLTAPAERSLFLPGCILFGFSLLLYVTTTFHPGGHGGANHTGRPYRRRTQRDEYRRGRRKRPGGSRRE